MNFVKDLIALQNILCEKSRYKQNVLLAVKALIMNIHKQK